MKKKVSELRYNHTKQEPIPSLEHGDMSIHKYGENTFRQWQIRFIKEFGDTELTWDSYWGWQCLDKNSLFYAWQTNYCSYKAKMLKSWGTTE